jgi:magnesium transporter
MRRAMCKLPGGKMMHVEDDAEIIEAKKSTEKVLWIDIERPDNDDLRLLQDGFGFHELSITDVRESHTAPKLDEYEGYVFQIVMVPTSITEDRVEHIELSLYYMQGTLVTVRELPWPALDKLWDDAQRHPVQQLGKGAQTVYHTVLDLAVKAYEPVINAVEDEIDKLEPEVLDPDDGVDSLGPIFRLRRTLRRVGRLMRAQQENVQRLAGGNVKQLRKETCYLFRDLAQHLELYSGVLEDHRETLAGMRDTYIGIASNRLNHVMKTLTVFSALMLPLTFLTGLWGMNFDDLPLAREPLGFWLFLVVCLGVMGTMTWLMARAGWLRKG